MHLLQKELTSGEAFVTNCTTKRGSSTTKAALYNRHLSREHTCDSEKAFVILQNHCLATNLYRPLPNHDIPKTPRMTWHL